VIFNNKISPPRSAILSRNNQSRYIDQIISRFSGNYSV
jgi:hypothetical protein